MPFDICHMAWWRRVTLAKRMEAGAGCGKGWRCVSVSSLLGDMMNKLVGLSSSQYWSSFIIGTQHGKNLFWMMHYVLFLFFKFVSVVLGRNLQITSILVDLYSCIYIYIYTVVPATPTSHQSQLVTVTAGRKLRPTCEVCEKVESRYREELSAEIFSRICQG